MEPYFNAVKKFDRLRIDNLSKSEINFKFRSHHCGSFLLCHRGCQIQSIDGAVFPTNSEFDAFDTDSFVFLYYFGYSAMKYRWIFVNWGGYNWF